MSFFDLFRGRARRHTLQRRPGSRPHFRPGAEQLESRLAPAGFKVTPLGGLVTTEKFGADTFTVALTARPTATVLVNLRTSDQTEGSVSPTALVFNAANWNTPKTVTVRGVNDFVDDGNIPFQIILDPA